VFFIIIKVESAFEAAAFNTKATSILGTTMESNEWKEKNDIILHKFN